MSNEIEEEAAEQAECEECSAEHDETDLHEMDNGNVVCDSCRDDNYSSCEDCDALVPNEDIRAVNGGNGYVCDSCVDNNYSFCSDCEEYVHSDDTRWTLHEETVCDSCADNNYSYCDECDGLYHHDSGDEHEHGGCDCDVPTNLVSIRNGDDILEQDERVTISLPAGFISDEGIGAISRLIRESAPSIDNSVYQTDREQYSADVEAQRAWYRLSYDIEKIGAEWQTKDGNYTKRLSRFAYKNHALKITPDIITKVGNIGAQHSVGADLDVEITRDLNLPAEEFAHSDSCWWQSYSSSRCSLKNNGGFALRSFGDSMYNPVDGRAWVMPLRLENGSLTPTFDAANANAYVVFNGYGNLNGYTPARIMAHMTGMSYRKIGFENEPMYINGESGYLVGPEEIVAPYTDGHLRLYTDEHSRLFTTEKKEYANA